MMCQARDSWYHYRMLDWPVVLAASTVVLAEQPTSSTDWICIGFGDYFEQANTTTAAKLLVATVT